MRSLSGTLEEILPSSSLDDVDRPRLPRIHDPHTGVRRVAHECARFAAWAKTQSWLPTAVVFLGVVLLIAVPSVSLLRASDGDRRASAGRTPRRSTARTRGGRCSRFGAGRS